MSETASETAVVKTSSKGLRIALAVSVALNLAVAGMFAGSFLHDRERRDNVREIGFGPFTEALSHEDRKALRKALMAKMPEMRQARQEVKQDMQTLLGVLRAQPFDAGKLSAVMEAQRVRMAGRFEVGQNLMRDLLVSMTPQARLAFADRLEKHLRRAAERKAGKAEGKDSSDAAAP
ncbi:periplasmic heavy metal sensor [Cypionkella sp.]|uniref:periplasmic heavy metal sensor n=1 Tax=Cypionkella sp. TaxID=2811411 RepID=UPI0026317404|nr:periplasmic heavy metal sensor [Cypionkella sp.]MDB5663915.1 hypothetical protein [Cypionkella sp.]